MTDAELDAALEALRRTHHVNDEDCWYSCPQSGECCRDDAPMMSCDCGADAHNAILDTVIEAVHRLRGGAQFPTLVVPPGGIEYQGPLTEPLLLIPHTGVIH